MAQHLNNHHPERNSIRIDKISNKSGKDRRVATSKSRSLSNSIVKNMSNTKRRQLIKQNSQDKF